MHGNLCCLLPTTAVASKTSLGWLLLGKASTRPAVSPRTNAGAWLPSQALVNFHLHARNIPDLGPTSLSQDSGCEGLAITAALAVPDVVRDHTSLQLPQGILMVGVIRLRSLAGPEQVIVAIHTPTNTSPTVHHFALQGHRQGMRRVGCSQVVGWSSSMLSTWTLNTQPEDLILQRRGRERIAP